MSEFDARLAHARANDIRPKSGIWFAWYPVRLGALGTGRVAFRENVWFCTALGITIYQAIEHAPKEAVERWRNEARAA